MIRIRRPIRDISHAGVTSGRSVIRRRVLFSFDDGGASRKIIASGAFAFLWSYHRAMSGREPGAVDPTPWKCPQILDSDLATEVLTALALTDWMGGAHSVRNGSVGRDRSRFMGAAFIQHKITHGFNAITHP